MVKIGIADEYKVARETLERMLKENQTAEGRRRTAAKTGTEAKK